MTLTVTIVDRYARLARGCRPRGCRAPARRVHGRRVRYVIGDEPGQVNGMRWPTQGRGALFDLRLPPRGRDQPRTA
ncbi:tryptophan biosynthesis modulator TrpM [Streptomyces sp. NY05-11A]|uniref:tryptophan biosynthesis modulator TrpM n=1 Tax=Streptomyces soliscabiei TaxID=588897 RepID=UPI0039F70BDC